MSDGEAVVDTIQPGDPRSLRLNEKGMPMGNGAHTWIWAQQNWERLPRVRGATVVPRTQRCSQTQPSGHLRGRTQAPSPGPLNSPGILTGTLRAPAWCPSGQCQAITRLTVRELTAWWMRTLTPHASVITKDFPVLTRRKRGWLIA